MCCLTHKSRGPGTKGSWRTTRCTAQQKVTDITAGSSWGLRSMPNLLLTEKCQGRWRKALSVSCGMPAKIDGNVFPTNTAVVQRRYLPRGKKKKTSLMSNDDFSYVLRFDEKKMFRHQNSCWFLLRLGCWVEMPVVSGGHRVGGPHPISFQCVLIKVPQVIRGDLTGSKRPGCPLM